MAYHCPRIIRGTMRAFHIHPKKQGYKMQIGKILKLTIISAIMAVFGLSQMAFSEELPKAGKRMNTEYFEIVVVKYKAGMAGKAAEYIEKYFAPATKAAGTPIPYIMHMQTGAWDAVFFWKQKGGMGDFDWYVDADGEKWYAELAKQNGGVASAKKIFDGYYAMVANSRREIGHHHMPPEEKTK